jgi:hypothetical protein
MLVYFILACCYEYIIRINLKKIVRKCIWKIQYIYIIYYIKKSMNKNTFLYACWNTFFGWILSIVLTMLVVWVLSTINFWIDQNILQVGLWFASFIIFIIISYISVLLFAKNIKSNHKDIVGLSTIFFAICCIVIVFVLRYWDLLTLWIYTFLFYSISAWIIKWKTDNFSSKDKVTI